MEIIFLLIPLSLVLVVLAIYAFSWANKSGQFDDLDSPALSILDDEVEAPELKDEHDIHNNHDSKNSPERSSQ